MRVADDQKNGDTARKKIWLERKYLGSEPANDRLEWKKKYCTNKEQENNNVDCC